VGDTFNITDESGESRLTGLITDPGATSGDVLTVQDDGSISAEAGGGSVPSGTLIGQSYDNEVTADNPTAVTCDGNPHDVECLIASPPSWMDDAGNIIAAGLYWVGANVQVTTPATTPGLSYAWISPAESVLIQSIDATLAFINSVPFDVLSLAAADLPFTTTAVVHGQSDVSAVLSVAPLIVQLASATS
jgi:hypothetical protein